MELTPDAKKLVTYKQTLIQTGLSPEQSALYSALIQSGSVPASILARRSGVSRTLTYKVLGELESLGLASKSEKDGKIALFTGAHPMKLKEMMEEKELQSKNAIKALESALGAMSSDYNLAGGRPGVEFFEGMEGIAKVLEDTLSAKDIIYTYADLKAIDDVYRDLNKDYLEKRKRRGIKKRGILADTVFTRKMLATYDTDVTDSRLIKYPNEPSKTIIQMYDDKTSYIVMDRSEPISFIIHDPYVTKANRANFDLLWNYAESFLPSASRSNTA